MNTTHRTRVFTVPLENKTGTLAELTRSVASAKVNITGVDVIANGGKDSTVRLLVSDPAKMDEMLTQKGITFEARDALSVQLPNQPGALAEVSERLAKGDVNIETVYGYAGHSPTASDGEVVLQVADIDQAEKLLRT